ncbi:class III poly(R)-hydroxyalkanoic acid synthase subunit PhaE [Lysobacter sp. H21R4]|uniref:class III poly(R)-hydroxyalkanoic acid synthase subunit PhaE n=1 Tax=Lysobacter sp. H21R4 TaxID=2781021 RepID=UPI00188842AA|nr:class III poly(R)-hydroxyalkanoic acid synthase subunit PhaE [Lysobacter sp. H21R4]QOY63774.1 class III poly(R)-hydroxyalkanoic acid synthase subunit PhaE [Lysobacter sp. H21R4]
MSNQGFGSGGFPPGGFGNVADAGELGELARQYWSQWGEMLRAGGQGAPASGFVGTAGFPGMGFPGGNGPTATPGLPGWNEAVNWWSQLASGGMPQADATVQRFNTQAQGWYAQIQELAARFAGQDASARDVSQAWKEMFGGHAANPFADALKGMQGQGQQGFEQWMAQVSPWLEKLREGSNAWLETPTFGLNREHEQRWKELIQAQQAYQRHNKGYQALMSEALQDAFKRFEKKLDECSQPGNRLESMGALFDLWIDAAEDAYADIAISPRFRDAYGALGNAQMALRAAVQKEIEHLGDSMGMPSRTEVDAAHRKITQLERELRQLRDRIDAAGSGMSSRATTANSTGSGAPESTTAPGAQPAAAARPASRERDIGGTDDVSGRATKKVAKRVTRKPASKAAKTVAKTASSKRPAKTVAKKSAKPSAASKTATRKTPAKKTAATASAAAVKKTTTKAG